MDRPARRLDGCGRMTATAAPDFFPWGIVQGVVDKYGVAAVVAMPHGFFGELTGTLENARAGDDPVDGCRIHLNDLLQKLEARKNENHG